MTDETRVSAGTLLERTDMGERAGGMALTLSMWAVTFLPRVARIKKKSNE